MARGWWWFTHNGPGTNLQVCSVGYVYECAHHNDVLDIAPFLTAKVPSAGAASAASETGTDRSPSTKKGGRARNWTSEEDVELGQRRAEAQHALGDDVPKDDYFKWIFKHKVLISRTPPNATSLPPPPGSFSVFTIVLISAHRKLIHNSPLRTLADTK